MICLCWNLPGARLTITFHSPGQMGWFICYRLSYFTIRVTESLYIVEFVLRRLTNFTFCCLLQHVTFSGIILVLQKVVSGCQWIESGSFTISIHSIFHALIYKKTTFLQGFIIVFSSIEWLGLEKRFRWRWILETPGTRSTWRTAGTRLQVQGQGQGQGRWNKPKQRGRAPWLFTTLYPTGRTASPSTGHSLYSPRTISFGKLPRGS